MKSFSTFFLLLFLLVSCSPKTAKDSAQSPTPPDTPARPTPPPAKPLAQIDSSAPILRKPVDSLAPYRLPLDPAIRMGKLSNGMTYYLRRNNKPENRAELRLAVNVGSAEEQDDQQGLAHFLEHMCFNGTEKFSKNELIDYLESVGTKFGPDLNAYTSFEETVYMLQVRTDDSLQFYNGLTVLREWAQHVTFDSLEVEKERGVVHSEWRGRLGAGQRMNDEIFPKKYAGSRFANRLPIGKPEIIDKAPRARMIQFYRDWYRPENMALVVVGNIEPEKLEKEVRDMFGFSGSSSPAPARSDLSIPEHQEIRVLMASDKEATDTRVSYAVRMPEKPYATLSDMQLRLQLNMANAMFSSRLDELTRSANPPFLFAFGGYGGDLGKYDALSLSATVPQGGIETGLQTLAAELERVRKFGFTDSEFEREVKNFLRMTEKRARESEKTESVSYASACVSHFLNQSPLMNADQFHSLAKRFLSDMTVDEVNKAFIDCLRSQNRSITITAPRRENTALPDPNKVLAAWEAGTKSELKPYQDNRISGALVSDLPAANPIRTEKLLQPYGITELILGNGVRVLVKQTDFKNDEIQFLGTSWGGSSLYDSTDIFNAENADEIVSASGLSRFSAIQLEKYLSGKVANIRPGISELSESLNGNCSPDDLETFLQLVYLYFTDPRTDPEAFQSLVKKNKAAYQNQMSSPGYFFNAEMLKAKFNNHPRRQPVVPEKFDQLNLERSVAIFRERFANAADFTFLFVGNIDPSRTKEMLNKYLGALPAKPDKELFRDVSARLVKGQITKDYVKGQAPRTQVDMTFHGPYTYSQNNNYLFSSMVDLLRIKLRENLREDKGGVYGVSVSGSTIKYPRNYYTVNISFNCDPDKKDTLIAAVMQEIKNFEEHGPEEKDLTKVRETQKQDRIKNLKENRFWLGSLNRYVQYDDNLSEITLEVLDVQQQGLTRESMKTAGALYLNEKNMMVFTLSPETAGK